ncbi:MAG: RimK family alpha-L-glutamate ligase [Pseudomonadota bacterium]
MPNSPIAIITDDPGWHGRQLAESFSKRGYSSSFIRLQDCHFETHSEVAEIHLPGFDHLPLAVFVRGIPGGTLEEVIYYLDVLHGLEAMDIRVINNVRAIERSVDKGMTSFLLKLYGINTPKSFYSSDLHYINNKLREEFKSGKEYVLKPIFGSQGKGVQKISCQRDIIDYSEWHGVMYIQEFIDAGYQVGVDYRIFVVGHQVISSMKRTGTDWITNVAQGGQVEAVDLPVAVKQMALEAVQVLNLEYAGVDLIEDKSGQFWVTEVNSVPAWKGLQSTMESNVVDVIADDFLKQCDLPILYK